ncbi:glycerophosphodiester phosphodiesterase family protein [Kocuria sp.]|uniref:glycerophosphodiester phosphodiesterase family protein n=1 Tax=Kocuria sp. TaxID=1871328 RepID=UPI0026E05AEB|nr:glycerophosphodiester phosphodiesterase family protein [Kocuria sp.]MDO5617825.1 glycerophosphodiester phosphodiesterase family protein [Kocuria sp.]
MRSPPRTGAPGPPEAKPRCGHQPRHGTGPVSLLDHAFVRDCEDAEVSSCPGASVGYLTHTSRHSALAKRRGVRFAETVQNPGQPGTDNPAFKQKANSGCAPSFDLQSHRGGRGHWSESSLHAFGRSLELGVTTLELDTHLSADNVVVVWHDHHIEPIAFQDTTPAVPHDPAFPYVGARIRELTLAQLKTLNCGFQQAPGFAQQQVVAGNRMATLREVFDLVRGYNAQSIRWNIETKVEDPGQSAQRDALVDAVIQEIHTHGWPHRTQLQSFDWAALDRAARVVPELELVALAPAQNPAGAGLEPGEVAERGYAVWSPEHVLLTARNIRAAHGLGLKVVPWTVNQMTEMNHLLDWGVDGLITDYPALLRQVLERRGMALPVSYRPSS